MKKLIFLIVLIFPLMLQAQFRVGQIKANGVADGQIPKANNGITNWAADDDIPEAGDFGNITGNEPAFDSWDKNAGDDATWADIDSETEFEALLFAITVPSELTTALGGYVPNNRTVNGQALSSNIVLDPDDLDDTSTINKFTTTAEKSGWDEKLSDAPSDGTGYVRKDGAWAAESEGGVTYKAPQILSGTTPSYDASTSHDAKLTTSGETTITLSNFEDGSDGFLTVVNGGGHGIDFTYVGKAINYTNGLTPTSTNIHSAAGNITVFGIKLSGDTVHIGYNAKEQAEVFCYTVACSDESTDLTTGTAKRTFRFPFAATITNVVASVNTAPVGSTLTVDLNEAGTSIFSTVLSIDASEDISTTAATAAVISDTQIAQYAKMTVDVDQIGSTTAGNGLKLDIYYTKN